MRNSLTLRPHRAEAQLRRELARYAGDVNAVVKLTQLAMDEVGSLHHQAMKQVISSLQRTERKLRAAEARGQLTLAQRQEIHYLTLRYLDEIARIVDEAGMDILLPSFNTISAVSWSSKLKMSQVLYDGQDRRKCDDG